ncbi:MAG: DUF4332 domain-containing protein [Alphaproteobacteria bacterium]|nr:DUF4332 domain-containing protein [Alphaproteobacteria bacterium]
MRMAESPAVGGPVSTRNRVASPRGAAGRRQREGFMSALYSLVFATRCRSTHHKIAIDALRHLSCENAETWRAFFLHHHEAYLKGAKAPDDEFKDFKNHVLHVRDGGWGGALESAQEWRLRAERALAAGDWTHAARCAGVMSHYIADPHQPFHTHQTEEEGVIHRAVEWSFNKSYGDFQQIIDAQGGYGDLAVDAGDDWLAKLVREGAEQSTRAYELVIDHYDFAKGVKTPKAGLDEAIRDAIAPLVARAVMAHARALDRIIANSKAKPPRYGGSMQAFMLVLGAPLQKVLALIEDGGERKRVAAMFEEYRRTGKVRDTLPEDDRDVRALYAQEVLQTPLSSLDAKWPREIGALHTPDTGKKAARKPKSAKPPPVKREAAASSSPPQSRQETPPAPPQARVEPVADIAPARIPTAEEPVELVLDTPLPKKKVARGAKAPPAEPIPTTYTLNAASPVVDAPSIGPKTARRLSALGVNTVADLLSVSPATAAVLIGARHITAQTIHDWQSQATLACTVPDLKSREAQALVACDIRDMHALAAADAAVLTPQWAAWCASNAAERVWGDAPSPTTDHVGELIRRAKVAVADAKKRSEPAE